MAEKPRYSDEDLAEFKELILAKLDKAQREYDLLCATIRGNDNDTVDTSPTFKVLEEGASTLGREEAARLAERQRSFIKHLQAALVRIENKTYGVCRVTGQLIPKERLRAVPHATLSIDAKNENNISRTASARCKALWATGIILSVLIIDQIIKVWVKTNFYLGEDYEIFSWFHLRFIQNNGMAFGMEFGSKLLLTLFRIVAVSLGIWYLVRLCRNPRIPAGYVAVISLVVAGAAGNIADCLVYGEIFTNPYPPEVASVVSWGEGYGSLFHGLVVDMFYFPLFSFIWPEWMPLVGGEVFSFFDPVFNFADAAITVGMLALILFYYKYLGGENESAESGKKK